MNQPRVKLPPPQPRSAPSASTGFYPGPSVSDVLDRLRAADVDAGLIEAYLREEHLRSLARRGTTVPEAIALIKTAFRAVRATFSPDGNAQIAYALAGPSKGDCE